MDKVYGQLTNIEEEIEILKKQGGDLGGAYSLNQHEECRRHIELIIEMCQDIKQSSHHEVR